MSREPKWLTKLGEPISTRSRSGKQETKIAKALQGKKTINSGATFSENDVLTDYAEIEAKTTGKDSFSLRIEDIDKLQKKCTATKIPVVVVQFEKHNRQLAVISFEDLKFLIDKANETL